MKIVTFEELKAGDELIPQKRYGPSQKAKIVKSEGDGEKSLFGALKAETSIGFEEIQEWAWIDGRYRIE